MIAQPAEQLVGRTAELEVLDRVLAELQRAGPSALELAGEPRIGKTRMLAELRALAERRGQLVLSGGAAELGHELPFWSFVDALDDHVHGLDRRRLELIDQDACAELAHVFPSFPERDPGATVRAEPYRTHRAVRQLLEALAADKPLVLVLDDLHWADAGSIGCSARCSSGRPPPPC